MHPNIQHMKCASSFPSCVLPYYTTLFIGPLGQLSKLRNIHAIAFRSLGASFIIGIFDG